MSNEPTPKDPRDFLLIAKYATALSFGALTGSLWAMEASPSGLRFEFSAGVIPAALIGVVVAFIY